MAQVNDIKTVLDELAKELDFMAWQAEASSTIGRKRKELREHWLGRSAGTKLCAETVRKLSARLEAGEAAFTGDAWGRKR